MVTSSSFSFEYDDSSREQAFLSSANFSAKMQEFSLPLQSDNRLSLRDFYFGVFPLWSTAGSLVVWSSLHFLYSCRTDGEVSSPFFSVSEITFTHLSAILALSLPIFRFLLIFILLDFLSNEERCAITYLDNCHFRSVLLFPKARLRFQSRLGTTSTAAHCTANSAQVDTINYWNS